MRSREETPSFVYVAMAMLFIATAIVSFLPTSFGLISRVYSGQQALPPWVVHFHAASMSSWLLLLLTQSALAHAGRQVLHRRLGLASMLLAPCVLVSMYGVDLWGIAMFGVADTVSSAAMAPSDQTAQLRQYAASILLVHGASYLLFPVFYVWAILARHKDNEAHRRLMILATLVLLIPGIGRLLSITNVLPDLGLNLVDARHFYLLVLIAPALIYEVVERGVPHRSYLIGMALLLGWMAAAHFLFDLPWWREHAPGLLGVA